ncbi:MAG: ACT domain-containing protein [Ethanoligenens sp.]
MEGITTITVTEDVALITLRCSPADIRFISHVFSEIAKKGVNVDMISQTTPVGNLVSLSFSVSDNQIGEILEVCALLRTETPQIKTDINSGNCKISLSGEAMRTLPGVAARAFDALAEIGTDIRMITTSEVDISILIPQAECMDVRGRLEQVLAVHPQIAQNI